ncbi:MAG: DUF2510 domain-containing protein [Mycobacteriales bacterium]
MSQPLPPAGWYPDPASPQLLRYWDGSTWTDHTQPNPQPAQPSAAVQTYAMAPQRQVEVTRYNQRMANRVARRAHLTEPAVAVAFTYNNLATMLIFGLIEDLVKVIPTIGELLELGVSLFSFYFHRILIVTDRRIYVYRDWPFHYPGKQLAMYERGPGVVRMGSDNQGWWSRLIRRGQLTFHDGTVVYHSPIWIRRAHYIAQEGNIPPGQ